MFKPTRRAFSGSEAMAPVEVKAAEYERSMLVHGTGLQAAKGVTKEFFGCTICQT